MSVGLRGLVDRSLDAQRVGAFVAAACVLLLVAGGLALTADRRARSTSDTDGSPASVGTGSQRAVVAPPLVASPETSGRIVPRDAVVRQARRFLAGCLPFLYGQGPAGAIRGSTTALRRRLETMRLRVPPAARKRRPRVVRVTAEPMDQGRWHVVATIADGGVAEYPIELLITTTERGLRVAEVSSE